MKFFKYFVLVSIFVMVVDLFNRLFYDYMYSNIPQSSPLNLNYGFQLQQDWPNILVLGASRAKRSYKPKLISDSLGVSVFNMGKDGAGILYYYLCLQSAIQSKNLKCVVLEMDKNPLLHEWLETDATSFMPFYWKNDNVKTVVNHIKGWEAKYIACSSLCQFNSCLSDTYKCWFIKRHDDSGYEPLQYTGKPALVKTEQAHNGMKFVPDSVAIDYFNKCVKLCEDNNVKLVVADSPTLLDNSDIDEFLSQYCTDNNILFWNFSNYHPIVSDKRLFANENHLNDKGAEYYSSIITNQLKRIINTIDIQ